MFSVVFRLACQSGGTSLRATGRRLIPLSVWQEHQALAAAAPEAESSQQPARLLPRQAGAAKARVQEEQAPPLRAESPVRAQVQAAE